MPNKSVESRRCSNYRKSNYRASTVMTEIFFFKNHAGNEAERLVPDLFLFLKKDLYKVRENGLQLGFTIFQLP